MNRLKQAPRAWYIKIESFFLNKGFEKFLFEYTMFVKKKYTRSFLIVRLYVDDLSFIGNCEKMFMEFKDSVKKHFDMTNFGKMNGFLGLRQSKTQLELS